MYVRGVRGRVGIAAEVALYKKRNQDYSKPFEDPAPYIFTVGNWGKLNDQNESVFAVLFVVCTVLHADLYLFSVGQISSVSSNR